MMSHLRRILAIGGGAVAGAMVAIGAGKWAPSLWFMFIAMCVSSILGGLAPLIGYYAGIGSVLGFLLAMPAVGLREQLALMAWIACPCLGALAGSVCQYVRRTQASPLGKGRQQRGPHVPRQRPADRVTPGADQRSLRKEARLLLVAGPLAGALVSSLLDFGVVPLFLWSVFIGAVVGGTMFGAFVAADLWEGRDRGKSKGE